MFLRVFTTVALIATSMLAVAPAANAAKPTITAKPDGTLIASIVVSYADLDMRTIADRRTLERRVESAAIAVCRNEVSLREEVRCRTRAHAQGAQKIALVVDRSGRTQVAARDR